VSFRTNKTSATILTNTCRLYWVWRGRISKSYFRALSSFSFLVFKYLEPSKTLTVVRSDFLHEEPFYINFFNCVCNTGTPLRTRNDRIRICRLWSVNMSNSIIITVFRPRGVRNTNNRTEHSRNVGECGI